MHRLCALSRRTAAITVALALCAAAPAAAETIAPPGNSGVDQYLEVVPSAKGPSAPGTQQRALSSTVQRKLQSQGAEGRRLAQIVRTTAPAQTATTKRSKPDQHGQASRGSAFGLVAPGRRAARGPAAGLRRPRRSATARARAEWDPFCLRCSSSAPWSSPRWRCGVAAAREEAGQRPFWRRSSPSGDGRRPGGGEHAGSMHLGFVDASVSFDADPALRAQWLDRMVAARADRIRIPISWRVIATPRSASRARTPPTRRGPAIAGGRRHGASPRRRRAD